MAEKSGSPKGSQGSEDKGFKVVDRRRVGVDEPAPEPPTPDVAAPEPTRASLLRRPAPQSVHEQILGPIDFQTFLVSLASSALIHLGEASDPETGKTDASFPHAKQTIDLLALLQQKTAGNLTPDEARLLQDLLRDLRLRFVQVTSMQGTKAVSSSHRGVTHFLMEPSEAPILGSSFRSRSCRWP